MKNNPKSNETLSVDSAVWYIEGALNYTYGDHDPGEIIKVDSASIPITVGENNTIEIFNIVTAYNLIEENLHNISGNNTISIADITHVEKGAKGDNNSLSITVLVKGGIPNLDNFGADDYWHAGWGQGKCDEGELSGEDAATQIAHKANFTRAFPNDGYITDIITILYYPGEFDPYQRYLWSEGSDIIPEPEMTPCLTPDEMNYWLDRVKTLANLSAPDGKHVVGYRMEMDAAASSEYWLYVHTAYLSYGTFHGGSPEQ
ncbi:MAG: hypothetical protein U9N85_07735 [Bacteroidota bacterium]|nr:hypothetical protein [Bacteroidota bacterium]